jgi:hypothetical protein
MLTVSILLEFSSSASPVTVVANDTELRFIEGMRMARDRKGLQREFKPAQDTHDCKLPTAQQKYLEVQKCLGNPLNPTEWGWKAELGTLVPVPTLLLPAPPHLMRLVTCGCVKGCKPGTNCSCRGAVCHCVRECTAGCGGTCTNSANQDDKLDDSFLGELPKIFRYFKF